MITHRADAAWPATAIPDFQSCQQPDTFLSRSTGNSNCPRGSEWALTHIQPTEKKNRIRTVVRDVHRSLRNVARVICAAVIRRSRNYNPAVKFPQKEIDTPRHRQTLCTRRPRSTDPRMRPWDSRPTSHRAITLLVRLLARLFKREWAPYPPLVVRARVSR